MTMTDFTNKIKEKIRKELKEKGVFGCGNGAVASVTDINIIDPFTIDERNRISFNGSCQASCNNGEAPLTRPATFSGHATLNDDGSVTLDEKPMRLTFR